jgi:phospholipid N-methyltransferase
MTAQLSFFKEALKTIKSSGAIVPSSKWLTQRIVNAIDCKHAKVVVELGAGNGVFTKKLLSKLSDDSQLIVFEINDLFYNKLLQINDSRLTVLKYSAEDLQEILQKRHLEKVDYIISSLPLTNMSKTVADKILEESYNSLNDKGVFLQYQYSLGFYSKLKSTFKGKINVSFELLNLPPAFLYTCYK